MKSYADSLGYKFTVKPKSRTSWRTDSCGVALCRPLSSAEIGKERNRLIEEKVIDVGRPVCPITQKRLRVHTATGNVRQEEKVVSGRCISLQAIRQKHLADMDKLGFLRRTDVTCMCTEQLKHTLDDRNGIYASYKLIVSLIFP